MKRIKTVAAGMLIALAFLFPSVGYADTLPQVLSENSHVSIDQKQAENPLRVKLEEIEEEKLEHLRAEFEESQLVAAEIQARAARRKNGQRVVDATYQVPSPGVGWCALWVSQCYNAAGFGYLDGDADDMYWAYCTSSNREDIVPGMLIAVPSHAQSGYAGVRYGHIGIIVYHDSQYYVRDNIGYINERTLDEWIEHYGTTYTPQWGFAGDI